MFGSPNKYVTVSGFGVRVKDEREKNRNHIIEVAFEMVLTHDLADEILPAMKRDLFQEAAPGEWTPKPEIQDASFNVATDMQLMTVKGHPETDPFFRVEGVSLKKVRVAKIEGGLFMLLFTAQWTLGADTEATAIIRALKSGVYLTLEAQQQTFLDPGNAPDGDQVANVDAGGNVTSIKSRKKRTKSPEAEAESQSEAGAAMAANDDAAAAGGE